MLPVYSQFKPIFPSHIQLKWLRITNCNIPVFPLCYPVSLKVKQAFYIQFSNQLIAESLLITVFNQDNDASFLNILFEYHTFVS